MADVVHYKLERMVRELDDLERRGIFNRREIAEIVKQRRKFEYRMKRPSPLKQDFLAYIDFEKQVDELRFLRKKAIARRLRDTKDKSRNKLRKTVSDFSGVTRIINTYRLATARFKDDIQLWFQYLEYCRQLRNGRMNKVLAQVFRYHPKVPGIWIYAAAWEFDHKLNAIAARAFMQSGLRECPTSEDLWVEYLRMELTYLNKLKARKVALGEGGKAVRNEVNTVDKQWKDENKELFMEFQEKEEYVHVPNDLTEESTKQIDLLSESGWNILQTIYRNAVEALPSSFSLRKRFLEILEISDVAHSEEMRKDILKELKRDFSKEPEYWDWLARLEVAGSRSAKENEGVFLPDQLYKTIEVYEEALEALPTFTMFSLYVKFLMDAISQQKEDIQDSGCIKTNEYAIDLTSLALATYEKAEKLECLSEDLACGHLSFLLKLGRPHEAKILAEKLCNGKLWNAMSLWQLRFSIEMRCLGETSSCPSKVDASSVFEVVSDFFKNVSISEAEGLWLMALKVFAIDKFYFDKLIELSLVLLAKHGGSDDGFSLSSTIVNYVLQSTGVQGAREMYRRYLALPRPGLALFTSCIQLEMNLATAGNSDSLIKARTLFESALSTYDQVVPLWRDYYSMEIKMGTSETAAGVHWRARKTLSNNVVLVTSKYL